DMSSSRWWRLFAMVVPMDHQRRTSCQEQCNCAAQSDVGPEEVRDFRLRDDFLQGPALWLRHSPESLIHLQIVSFSSANAATLCLPSRLRRRHCCHRITSIDNTF